MNLAHSYLFSDITSQRITNYPIIAFKMEIISEHIGLISSRTKHTFEPNLLSRKSKDRKKYWKDLP